MSNGQEARARTLAVKAMKELTETELRGLRIALETIARTEHAFIASLVEMKRGALQEDRVRGLRDLPMPGPYRRAYEMTRELVRVLTDAREDTETVVHEGNVTRQRKPRR